MELAGDLIRLRPLRPEDADMIVANLADPEVVRHLELWSRGPYGPADAREFIERRGDGIRWTVEVLDGGRPIGVTDLRENDYRNRHCFWGIQTGPPEVWGHGYGTEACRLCTRFAFQHLGLEKVYLDVLEPHRRGRRAYEKAGYRVEGELRRDTWLDGDLVTRLRMAAYRDDPAYAG